MQPQQLDDLIADIRSLSESQQQLLYRTVQGFNSPRTFIRNPSSDFVSEEILQALGDRLIAYHISVTGHAMTKERFEHAVQAVFTESGLPTTLTSSMTHPGHDITIGGVPISLKSEAAKAIKEDTIHVSKWMELGKGAWHLPTLLALFLQHLTHYERIFTMRCLSSGSPQIRYELVEIPKALLLRAQTCSLVTQTNSRQNPQPGYGYVYSAPGVTDFALYFDGGSERKLQIKHLKKSLCVVHATWSFPPISPSADALELA